MLDGWTSQPNCRNTTGNARVEGIGDSGGRILYIDEHTLTRDCISRELERHLPERKVAGYATAREIAADGASAGKFAVAVLYIHANQTDARTGRETGDDGRVAAELSLLEQLAPEAPRVLLSDLEVPEDIVRAFRRRIRGYVPTTLPIKQVAEAIRFVIAGGTFVPPSILALSGREDISIEGCPEANPSSILANFSPRQSEVLRRLWRGSSNKIIAYELRMCESTVKVHIRHIMKKLNVSNRTQVVVRTRPSLLGDAPQTNARDHGKPPRPSALADTFSLVQSCERPHGVALVGSLGNRSRQNGSPRG
jgi:DNA-binding NarL/FixJ family response regulator